MAEPQAHAQPMPAPQAQALEEPQVTFTGKACAVGGGVIAAVC